MKAFLRQLAIVLPIGLGTCFIPHTVAEEPVDEKPIVNEGDYAVDKIPDPWQPYNRFMFSVNDSIDRVLTKPLAIAYRTVMPDPLETGVSNVFSNVGEVPNAINSLLQGNVRGVGRSSGRFLVNSTLGVAGIFDVAKYMNLERGEREDFGQTLGVWGFGSGPYLVLPFLGPSTLRDGLARPVDWYTDPLTYIDHVRTDNTVRGLSLLNIRAQILPLEQNISGDKYIFVRDVYLQRRDYLINDGMVIDDFGVEEFDDDEFEF